MTDIFAEMESNVRSYCRHFPALFATARGSWLTTSSGERYLDFLSGAGTLNYGHNDPEIMHSIHNYMESGGIVHSLDLHTVAKARFLEAFRDIILRPRNLDFKLQFTNATGANAVEAALKIVRKATGRRKIAAFTNAYHGMSLGALAATHNINARAAAGVPLEHVVFWPYDVPAVDTIAQIEIFLREESELPGGVLLETVQGEGGLNAARPHWVEALSRLCEKYGILLIVDDIQAGCGRTGSFFSFEEMAFTPDVIILSKSLSGFGAPFSMVLLRPDLDIWNPGEHTGTFRGNNLAFVGATAALERYWQNNEFANGIRTRAGIIFETLNNIVECSPPGSICIKGRGLIIGLGFAEARFASQLSAKLYQAGVIAETCGPKAEVLKFLPALNIPHEDLAFGILALRTTAGELFN